MVSQYDFNEGVWDPSVWAWAKDWGRGESAPFGQLVRYFIAQVPHVGFDPLDVDSSMSRGGVEGGYTLEYHLRGGKGCFQRFYSSLAVREEDRVMYRGEGTFCPKTGKGIGRFPQGYNFGHKDRLGIAEGKIRLTYRPTWGGRPVLQEDGVSPARAPSKGRGYLRPVRVNVD